MIPPLLHQTWKSTALPGNLRAMQSSFVAQNPAMELRFYDDEAMRGFVRDAFPVYLPTFDGLAFPVLKADLFRLLVVLEFGGFYADIDMECLAPLSRFYASDSAVFGIEAQVTPTRQRELGYDQPFQIANCIFAAPPGHPFIRKMVDQVVANLQERPVEKVSDVEDATGPKALTRIFYAERPRDVQVLKQICWVPPDIFADFAPTRSRVMCRHHFLGSWKDNGPGPTLKRRLIERNRMPNPFPLSIWHDFGWS